MLIREITAHNILLRYTLESMQVIKRHSKLHNAKEIVLCEKDKEIGSLIYRTNRKGTVLNLILVEITPEDRHKGFGKYLLKEFVLHIGPQKRVTGAIEHPETWKILDNLGFIKKTAENSRVHITQKESLIVLPIVRFLNSGGVYVNKIILSKRPSETAFLDPEKNNLDKVLKKVKKEYTLYFKATFEASTKTSIIDRA